MMKINIICDSDQWTRSEKTRWLYLLVIGTSAVYASRSSVPLLIPVIAKEKNWSKSDTGAVLSSFFWGYTLTQVFGGYLADRIGGQKVILYAALGWGLITMAMPTIFATSSEEFSLLSVTVAARIAHGAFQGVHFPGMSSLASQQMGEKDRASFFSLATSGSALGTLMTGTFGSFILDAYNWQTVLYVIGILCMIWTYFFNQLVYSSRPSLLRSNPEPSKVPWSLLFRKPAFWALVLAHACQNNCFFTLISWLPTYFHDTYPEAKGWVVNMVPWLFTIPFTFLGKAMSERLREKGFTMTSTRKIVEATCLLTQAFGLVMLNMADSLETALLCIVLTIGATGFHNSAVVVNPGDLAPKHSGSVFGLMNTVGSIPGFLGVYIAGEMLEHTHSWSTVFLTTAAVNVFGCFVYIGFASGTPVVHNI